MTDSVFKIGQDVVCISAKWLVHPGQKQLKPPELNRIYRVKGMVMSTQFANLPKSMTAREHLLLQFEEDDAWSSAEGFRPVKDTDISIFYKALGPGQPTGVTPQEQRPKG